MLKVFQYRWLLIDWDWFDVLIYIIANFESQLQPTRIKSENTNLGRYLHSHKQGKCCQHHWCSMSDWETLLWTDREAEVGWYHLIEIH